MSLVMTSGPAAEPISIAEAKAHLRVDGSAEDVLIASLILTSRLHLEAALGLALIAQSWRLVLDAWPEGRVLALPLRPVQAITAIEVLAADGTPTALAPGDTVLDGYGNPARVIRASASWPNPGKAAGGIEIDFTAGYGATAEAVPAPLRRALLLLVAHWYEHRDPIEVGSRLTAIPSAVSELLSPFRTARL